jgi:predicted DNA-binding transcriptional regulator AlpA
VTIDVSLLMTKTDVAAFLGVSRERVTQLAKRADFPASLGLVGKSLVWLRGDVEQWAKAWDRRGGRPPAKEKSS